MQLKSLRVLHLPKNQGRAHSLNVSGKPGIFCLDTCQRWVGISKAEVWDPSSGKEWEGLGIGTGGSGDQSHGYEVYAGQDAYLFLLKWAAGLKSEVLGETDIFGQIKEAWRNAELSRDPYLAGLGAWIQRVFEDTKEIRSRYLQNLGGSSYGSLVRKLIKDQEGKLEGPILFVGAGQIAHSIASLFSESELWIWNRDPVRLCDFYQTLTSSTFSAGCPRVNRSNSRVKKIETSEAEENAWKDAAHVVVCIPLDEKNPERDLQRMDWYRQGMIEGSRRSVIHVGVHRREAGAWNSLPGFACLDDLFALQNSLGNIRSVQIAHAERACWERAQLRSLGASLSIPHGWEDLGCFA